MSDVNYSLQFRAARGLFNHSVNVAGITATMAADGMLSQTLTLSTNAASIQTAKLASVGLAYMQNLSTHTASTAAVGVNAGSGFVGFCTLKAAEAAMMRLTPGIEYEAKGGSGTQLRVDILEG